MPRFAIVTVGRLALVAAFGLSEIAQRLVGLYGCRLCACYC
ncbi:hypothetical protein J2T37_002318 [Neisseria perflava]|nr:hypothetical protein [Neisseria perflava]